MRGLNSFYLNQATIIDALQEYFDKRYAHDGHSALNVLGVSVQSDTFVVRVEGKDDGPVSSKN